MNEFDADRDGQNSLFFPNREGDVGTDCIDRTEDDQKVFWQPLVLHQPMYI